MKSLEVIEKLDNGDYSVLKEESWLKFLWLNESREYINIENFEQVSKRTTNSVLMYVKRTLLVLEEENDLSLWEKEIIETVLCWAETAKCGNAAMREKWKANEVNLSIHNIGSAQLFRMYQNTYASKSTIEEFIYYLIYYHGYVGQVIRGEVRMETNRPLTCFLTKYHKEFPNAEKILMVLNRCIIKAVSDSLYSEIKDETGDVCHQLVTGEYQEFSPELRLKRLRKTAISQGEDFNRELAELIKENKMFMQRLFELFQSYDLWYVEAATSSYTLEQMLKLLFLAANKADKRCRNLSFAPVMNTIYYDYQGKKQINVYKSRIIEQFLEKVSLTQISQQISSDHLSVEISMKDDIAELSFHFSKTAETLISFCESAEDQGPLYEKAIIMLYDLFHLRRDAYDRFNNEEIYLKQMNGSIGYKERLLDYIIGDTVIDIGPGGGALMDRIEERFPKKSVYGVDISENVVENLLKKKNREHKKWNVCQGNALSLEDQFEKNSVSSIILSSIVHELYSYIEYDGKKFNKDTLKKAFTSMFAVLTPNGRIIIRDGVMTEPKDTKRRILFHTKEGVPFLEQYCKDFKGRTMQVQKIRENYYEMPVNDAMEFLYTYTWGEESYSHEINEQFGYFTPSEYVNFFKSLFGCKLHVITCEHYLQEGYEEHLASKVSIFDEKDNPTTYPDSTIILVLEKVE